MRQTHDAQRIWFAVLCSTALMLACDTSRPDENRNRPAQRPPDTAGAPAPSAPQKPRAALKVETLADFEASAFCQEYSCRKDTSYSLAAGGTNNPYKTSLPDTTVEVMSDGDSVTGLGLSFYERPALQAPEFGAIELLLKSLDTTRPPASAMRLIRPNIEEPAFQVRQGAHTRFGEFQVWAAKVGHDQVLSLERSKAPSR